MHDSRLRSCSLALAALLAIVASAPSAGAARRSEKLAEQERAPKPDTDEATTQEAFKYFQFGNQFFQQGLVQKAQENFRHALQIQPAYPEASYMLGLVLYELNDFRGAVAAGDAALTQNPFLTEAHNLMGMAKAKMGDFDGALKEFEAVKADVSFPTPEVAHFNIGKVFWERQACGDAVIHFRRAIEINAQFWRGWYLMGDCQEQLGQTEQARQSYLKALEIQPNEKGPLYRLGFLCFSEGNSACARQYLDKVRELYPSSQEAAGAREYLRQLNFK